MKKKLHSLIIAGIVCLSFAFGAAAPIKWDSTIIASAVSTDYPPQLMNISVKDNSKVLTENDTADNSALSVKALGSDLAPSWRFDRVDADANGTFFKIVNAQSGRLITPKGYNVKAGSEVVVYGSESHKSQHWYVIPVKTDNLGNDLYYKIVNYSDTSLALTQGTNGIALASYTGTDNQLWLLNSDGLQGFAGYCKNDNAGNIKAADIGGIFGEVVEASTFDQLKKFAESATPYTIIVTKDISVSNLTTDSTGRYYCTAGRIYMQGNKTIIGSYSAHSFNNVQLCTKRHSKTSNNIIIKNLVFNHDAKCNANDSIQVYFSAGENLWVDHVSFNGHSKVNSQEQVDNDKFFACCYDADYCTVSDSFFGLHEYGLILGYPDDTEDSYKNHNNFPRMSIISNRFKDTVTRAPGLMRYGFFHSLNNAVYNFNMAYTVHSDCKLFAENCYYDGAPTNGNVVCDWNEVTHPGAFADSGSIGVNCKRLGIEGNAKTCTWRPNGNYDYKSLTAANAKNYCSAYSGCQNESGNMMYLRFSAKGVPGAGYTELPNTPTAAVFDDCSTYRFKNVNSGLYMQVENAKAENGANVQQWGSSDNAVHEIWKLISAGDGYYYIASALGDGSTYMLDVAGRKSENGTNVNIYDFNGGTNQQFMFTQNADGSYKIRTRISGEKSAIEVADASKSSGANVQQWEINGVNCQDWVLEPVSDPGCSMNTSVGYQFINVNSKMVMEAAGGKMTDGTNIQQWESNDYDCQKWLLQPSANKENYYYICSAADPDFAMVSDGGENGGNVSIAEYDDKNTSMLFKFSKSIDGTYRIMTLSSKDKCLVEVGGASQKTGANIQQWSPTNHDCQKWSAETFATTAAETTTVTTTTTAAQTTESSKPITSDNDTHELGDVNLDGKINVADVVKLQKHIVNIESITSNEAKYADMTKDNIINVYDLLLLKRLLLSI